MGVQNIPGSRFPELNVRSESQLLSENQRPEDINPNPQIPKSVTDAQFGTPLTPETRHLNTVVTVITHVTPLWGVPKPGPLDPDLYYCGIPVWS
jgi:hypothetical protein